MNDVVSKDAYGGSVIVSSPGMHEMAERITQLLEKRGTNFSHMQADYEQFANLEFKPSLPETVRGEHVFLLHPLQFPDPNAALMLMLLTADALMRASVSGITLVIPYISYLRQDRKDKPRVPISGRLLANLIECNEKIERIITLDMHTDQAQGFFSIPVDNISGMVVHAEYFRKLFHDDFSNVVVVAPDFGSAVRARRFAEKLHANVPVSLIDKRRTGPNQSEVLAFIGQPVQGRDVIVYDDMIDTGGTIRHTMTEILQQGARTVIVAATHGIFSNNAEQHFNDAGNKVVITTSIPRTPAYEDQNSSWLTSVSIDELLTDAIHEASLVGGSISKLSE